MAEILLGVSGSIAAYKAADLCSRLVKAGHGVSVVMTAGAKELVGPLTFATLTARPLVAVPHVREDRARVEHIDVTDRADLVVVAPATANLLGKAAHGIADDMLTTVLLAAASPILACPAMNPRMWANPLVRENVERLRAAGWHFLEPAEGTVACGHTGQGRMREPAEIAEHIESMLQPHAKGSPRVPIRRSSSSRPKGAKRSEGGLASRRRKQ